ncbi:hypothetical protein PRIPAC_85730 [Pristionchus pacificus]|uniref:RING-type E3 ubiquitin transferase n=1 Tax=Pristionchus pacificus TaxID=54126 RepID=A0A2A6BKG6_PRIPA|nr:hypothetical protein PRIPAC_85730 [Pristionchus pacificus]|eukprot:PDM66281.1 zinc finger protein [Pristionchus pacificus]
MSSQGNEDSSQRNDDETRPVDGAARAAPAADDHPQRPRPPPQPAPNDMFGLLGGMLPQAMGLLNQMMGGEGAPGGGASMREQAAAGGAANAQPLGDPRAPHVAAGVDRVLEVLQQQQRLWEDMGDRMDQSVEERRRRAEAAGQHGNNLVQIVRFDGCLSFQFKKSESAIDNDPLAAFLGQLGGGPAASGPFHAHPPQQQQQQQVLGPLQQGAGQPLPHQRAADAAAAPRPQQQQQQQMIGQLGGVLDELQQIVDEQPQRPAAAAAAAGSPPRPPPQQPQQQQPVSLARMIGQIAGVLGGLEHRMQPPPQQPAAAAAGSPPRPPQQQQQQHSPPVPDWRDVMAAVRAGADMATAAAAAAPAAAGQAPPILNFADLITTAASGLAGGAAPPRAGADPPGQSFEERLRAATERGEPSVPGGAGAPPPPPPMQLPGQILQLPRAFGGARIEIHGLPDNLGDVFARLRGWEQGQPGGGGGAVASRVPEEHLRLLPNSSVKQTHVDDQKQCFICMDTYTQVGEPVAEMTCGHIFHSPCIVPWLQANSTCPVCRAEVVSRNWVHDQFDLD